MENAAIGVRNIWQNTSPVSQMRAAIGPLLEYSPTVQRKSLLSQRLPFMPTL
jgi:hypothetical protein